LKPLLILCLGNEILSDDGFGPEVAKRLVESGDFADQAEVIFAPLAGFQLLEHLAGRHKVLIVDTIITGKVEAGTIKLYPAGVFTPSQHLNSSHQINLPTALELGRQMGMEMPQVIDVLTVEAQDVTTLCEELTPEVRLAVTEAVAEIKKWLAKNI
jgi:hydrogenase maturation protease